MAEQPTVGEACQVCGQRNPSTIERHHIVPDRFGGSDHPDNLVSLCGSCHNAIEAIYDDSFYQRLQQAGVPIKFPEGVGDDGGHELEADHYSLDRQLPQHSPHYQGDMIPVSLDGPKPATYEGDGEWVPVDEEEVQGTLPDFVADVAEEKDGGFSNAVMVHCGYCNRLYGAHQQSTIARHLQIEHNIENPYECEIDSPYEIGGGTVVNKIPNSLFVDIETPSNRLGFPSQMDMEEGEEEEPLETDLGGSEYVEFGAELTEEDTDD